jgi:hypothetical protein
MELHDTGKLLLLIKGIYLEFVIDEYSLSAWTVVLAEYEPQAVFQAARLVLQQNTWGPPKPEHIVKEIHRRNTLEWGPEAIMEFIRKHAWNHSGEQVFALCPPNVGKFLRSSMTWTRLIGMSENALKSYLKERATCFNARSQQTTLPVNITKMLKEVG